ncbi:PorV/PorQ family protein [bacterium]|nr:PorV/PorQ family protein [bacterium]
MKKIVFLLMGGLIVLSSTAVQAQSGMAFLKIGVGTRAAAMGEAQAVAGGSSASTYWNPAGLSQMEKGELMFVHNAWIQDISHEFLGAAFQTGTHHWGLALTTADIAGIERRTGPSDEPLGTISASNFSAAVSYARQLIPMLHVGVTAKYVYEHIYTETAHGLAFDLGLLSAPLANTGIQLALAVQNVGFTSELNTEAIDLPEIIRFGAAVNDLDILPFGVVSGEVDLVQIQNEDIHVNIGAEMVVEKILALRAGYQTGYADKGLGAGLGLFLKNLEFGYAYTPFSSNLGDSHRFSASWQF